MLLQKEVLDAMEKIVYTNGLTDNHGEPVDNCSLCLEDYKEGDEMTCLPGCGHFFHTGNPNFLCEPHIALTSDLS